VSLKDHIYQDPHAPNPKLTLFYGDLTDGACVRDIMSKNVIHVPPYMEAVDALKVFNDRSIGRLVVMVDGKLIGILSRTDMVRAMDLLAAGIGLGHALHEEDELRAGHRRVPFQDVGV